MTDSKDPTVTDPDKYSVMFENDRVRVLAYVDHPGDRTNPHVHPDSVMVTLSTFRRRLLHGDSERDVALDTGQAHWLPAQEHAGHNIGDSDTRTIFIELKDPAPAGGAVGPVDIGPA